MNQQLPEGWSRVDPGSFGLPPVPLLLASAPGHGGYAPNIVLTLTPLEEISWDSWVESVLRSAHDSLPGSVLLDAQDIDGGGLWVLLTLVLEGRNLTQMQYLSAAASAAGEVGVQIVATCSTAEYPELHSDLDDIVGALDLGEVL